MMKINYQSPIEYSQITEYIYLGTNMSCDVHFTQLNDLGIKAEISLEKGRVEKPEFVDYYLWLPVQDFTPPTVKQLFIGVHALKNSVELKEPVYVHCHEGQGRSPTLVAAYLIAEGLSRDEALYELKQKRPTIAPSPSQIEALGEWEKKYRGLFKNK